MNKVDQLLSGKIQLNAQQEAFLQNYRGLKVLIQYLEVHYWNELPHLINYLLLKVQEGVDLESYLKESIQHWKKTAKAAQQIRTAFKKTNPWSRKLNLGGEQKAWTSPEDLKTIDQLCRTLSRHEWEADAYLVHFFESLIKAQKKIQKKKLPNGSTFLESLEQIPEDWYSEPWYYIYVQYFGTDENGKGGFGQLKAMLDYLEALGIKNIYILPHYESPNGDAGYDISDYRPARAYGGKKAFKAFMDTALERGFRVATDLVFNHSSVEHSWFQEALKGSSTYFNYYLKCPENWNRLNLKEVLKDESGDLYLYLPEVGQEGESVTSKRILIFPDVDQTLWLRQPVAGLEDPILFYREFYPFQVDLDIQNPEVIRELFEFLAEELSMGVLGKRTDAIAHWVKKAGTNAKNLPETYALQKLVKQFLKHLNTKSIILPEVVTSSFELKAYAGASTTILGKATTTGGDALLDFQLQGMLREMLYFQKTTPFWTQVFQLGPTGTNTSVPLLPIEHHDETYMGFILELEAMRGYLSSEYTYLDEQGAYQAAKRGIIYKNGMSAGARYADALNRDLRRLGNAFFCLYMMPATPVIYYGTEIGATNRWEQMQARQKEQYETLQSLLGKEKVGPKGHITFAQCEDPRELQRGPIPQSDFYTALKKKHPLVECLGILNALRRKYSALRGYHLAPLDSSHESILAMIKFPMGKSDAQNPPLLALSNLSERPLVARIPTIQFQTKLSAHHFSLRRVYEHLGAQPQELILSQEIIDWDPGLPAQIEIRLPPYSATLWELFPFR